MNSTPSNHKPDIDWLTVVAIAAIAISINVAVHEGVHALTCLAVGGRLKAYSALYVSCNTLTTWQGKIVDGSAPIFNIVAGGLLWVIVHNSRKQASETWFFLWLFMLMNWLYGAGYWVFSGIANVGDMATVISGWSPGWLWRVLMTIAGLLLFMLFIQLASLEFGKVIGGDSDEHIRRANKLGILSYFTSFVVVLIAGFFNPNGVLSLPVTAGLFAVAGGLSPLLWMMQRLRAKNFIKPGKKTLEIHRQWQWLVVAGVVVFLYVFVLGRTLYF
jgi:hypothetical protein